jgi:hypothetical protein
MRTEENGEVSDAVMLSNGNVLFSHQFGVKEITPGKNQQSGIRMPARPTMPYL